MATTTRIVVGVDGSPASLEALAWAATQAELTGSTLEAVTTWEWPTGYGWTLPLPEDFDPAGDAGRVLDKALAPVHQEHPPVDVVRRVEEGHPAEVLVEGSDGAQLLVVGSRGHGAFAGMLLGSVSAYCVAHARCPVLVYRTARAGT